MKQPLTPKTKEPSRPKTFCLLKRAFIILSCVLGFGFSSTTFAQITAVQSGPWNDPATWDIHVPTASDDVIIAAGITVDISSAGEACTTLWIGVGDDLNSGAIVMTGTSSLTVADGIILGDAAGATGTISIASASTILISGYIVEGDADISGVFDTNNGTVVFTGSANLLPDNLYQFNNLQIYNGTTTLVNSALQIDGNLLVNSGAVLDLGTNSANRNSTGGTLTITNGGSIKIGGTGTIPFNFSTHSFGASGTVEFYGANQTVPVLNSGQAYGNLIISGSGTKQLSGNLNVAGDLSIHSSILNLSTYTANRVSAGGTLTVADAATLRIAGSGTLPANFSTHAIGSTSTVDYRGTSSQNVSALNSGQKYGNLSIINSVKTLAGNITVAGTLTFGGTPNRLAIGSFTLALEGTISGSISSSRNFTGSVNSNLVLAGAVSRTIYFDVTTPGTTNVLNNLTINHNAIIATLGCDLVINGATTFTNGKLAIGANTLTLKGNVVNTVSDGLRGSTTGNLVANGTASPTLNFDQTTSGTTNALNNFTVNSTGHTVTIGSDVKINGNLTITAGTLDLAGFNGNRVSFGGTLTISNGAALKIGGTNTFPSNYNIHTIGLTSTVSYAGTNQAVAVLRSSQPYGNLNISGSGTKSLAGSLTAFSNLMLAGGKLSVGNNTLIISGTVTNTIPEGLTGSSSSNIVFDGTSSDAALSFDQTTPGTTNKIRNLIVNSSTKTLSLNNSLLVEGTVYPWSGVLASGGNLTLLSTASKTANVSAGANAGGYITGDVTVERYISSGRKWQLLSVATSGAQTIHEAWQEGQASGSSSSTGYGTWITTNDPNALADGFDYQSNDISMKTYVPSTNTWVSVPNTAVPISSATAYLIFVRGDRGCTSNNTNVSTTVLRTKGTLNQGDQSAYSVTAGKFGCLSNMFPSAIDFRLLNTSGGIDNAFYVWDPKLSGSLGYGAYQTFTLNSGNYTITPGGGSYGPGGSIYNTIQSGQGFLVHATGSNGDVQILESAKSNGSILVARPMVPQNMQLRVNLYAVSGNNTTLADGTLAQFDDSYAGAVDGEDAHKLDNLGETFSIYSNGQRIAVEKRKLVPGKDTLFFNSAGLKPRNYQLEIHLDNFADPMMTAFLEDSYTGRHFPLNLADTNSIAVAVDASPASKAANRFRIVFKTASVLPVCCGAVTAIQKSNTVEVQWQMLSELNITRYEVERSVDGISFVKIGNKTPGINNQAAVGYNWLDENPWKTNNYYRIKYYSLDGSFKYSEIVKLKFTNSHSGISVYPNPVLNKKLHVQTNDLATGKYSVLITNITGQQVMVTTIQHTKANETIKIDLPAIITQGSYQLQLTGQDGTAGTLKIIVQ